MLLHMAAHVRCSGLHVSSEAGSREGGDGKGLGINGKGDSGINV